MVNPGSEVFLRIPDGMPEGRLHRGRVNGFQDDACTLVLSDPSMAPGAGQQVLVHYEQSNEFVSRAAVVEATTDAVLELRLVGEAVSAERRREPRVSYLHVLKRVVEESR